MKRYMRTLLLVLSFVSFSTVAAMAESTIPSTKIIPQVARQQYGSAHAYRSSYKGEYVGVDGMTHTVVVRAVAVKREGRITGYSWLKGVNRLSGTELQVMVVQDGKTVFRAEDVDGALIEAEILMPSGDLVEVVVDANKAVSYMVFSVKTIEAFEPVN